MTIIRYLSRFPRRFWAWLTKPDITVPVTVHCQVCKSPIRGSSDSIHEIVEAHLRHPSHRNRKDT